MHDLCRGKEIRYGVFGSGCGLIAGAWRAYFEGCGIALFERIIGQWLGFCAVCLRCVVGSGYRGREGRLIELWRAF